MSKEAIGQLKAAKFQLGLVVALCLVWPLENGRAIAQERLFPTNLPSNQWAQFEAQGFRAPACGVIYRLDRPAWLTPKKKRPNGMPLGGVDTGCIDLEKNGTFGLTTIFNSRVPRRGPLNLPFLGVSANGKTWILADLDQRHVTNIGWDTVYYFAPDKEEDGRRTPWTPEDYVKNLDWQVRGVDEIHYWGHYPVADLEYELTELVAERRPEAASYLSDFAEALIPEPDIWELTKVKAPLSVGLRAWSPFIPGDIDTSLLPGIVFEVHLRNLSDAAQQGALAFTFPGLSLEESEGAIGFPRRVVEGTFSGVHVTNGRDIGYALGVVGEQEVRTGGELGTNGEAWAQIAKTLPHVIEGQPGASVALDYALGPHDQKVVRFILTWYSPRWRGGGTPTAGGRTYTHMYATRYHSALQAAEILAEQHEPLLRRVLAQQETIYTEEELPAWLRESLVNILHLITEDGLWAAAGPPIGDWCRLEDGFFALNECPQDCPDMEPIMDSFYESMALVYFFPKLALSTLRGIKAYQNPDGSLPVWFSRRPNIELVQDFAYQAQSSGTGVCYAVLADRYWRRTGDDEMPREFYPSIKRNVIFTMNLNTGPDGVISAPTGNVNRGDGFSYPTPRGRAIKFGGEHNGTFGMSSHLGGLHLAQLRIAQRMAEKVGDEEFARQCEDWIRRGTESLESKMWNGTYYLNYWDQETGEKSDLVYAYQLAGEWVARSHGLSDVFRLDRVRTTLNTIREVNVPLTKFGAVMFAEPKGRTTESEEAAYGAYNMFVSETLLLAMTYMYAGEVDFGLDLARRHWENIICAQGYTWEQPNLFRGDVDTGEVGFGSDYYQSMILWLLPAALAGEDLAAPAQPGGLVDRVLRSAR